jgi:hypothetical protein
MASADATMSVQTRTVRAVDNNEVATKTIVTMRATE